MVGSISARKAWEALERDPSAVLIDVRTPPEWASVGLPDLSILGRDTPDLPRDPFRSSVFAQTLPAAVPAQKTPDSLLRRPYALSTALVQLVQVL